MTVRWDHVTMFLIFFIAFLLIGYVAAWKLGLL